MTDTPAVRQGTTLLGQTGLSYFVVAFLANPVQSTNIWVWPGLGLATT